MSRRRFFVPPESISDELATLPAEEAHHLRHVLRVPDGEIVEIFDGAGKGYTGRVLTRGSDTAVVGLEAIDAGPVPRLDITLGLALLKSDRFEWALQKATELGVGAVIPLRALRCEVRLPESKVPERLERWRRIALSAAKQCRRLDVPALYSPMDFAAFAASRDLPRSTRVLFCEKAEHAWEAERDREGSLVLAVGPEGGWEAAEIETAQAAGFLLRSLGTRILRAETAAIAALAIMQYQSGDLRPRERS